MLVSNQIWIFIGQRHGCRARRTHDAVLVVRASVYIIFVLQVGYNVIVPCWPVGRREVLRLRRVLVELPGSHVLGAAKASLRARLTMTHGYRLVRFRSRLDALAALARAALGQVLRRAYLVIVQWN